MAKKTKAQTPTPRRTPPAVPSPAAVAAPERSSTLDLVLMDADEQQEIARVTIPAASRATVYVHEGQTFSASHQRDDRTFIYRLASI